MNPKVKLKKCAICKQPFQLFRSLQKCCSHQCALKLAVINREKDERRDHKKAKDKLKTKGEWAKEAQTAFNRYIRARDHELPCVSCGTEKPDVQYAAGHYFTVGGHPELRYNLFNVNKQCNKNCNMELSGNIAAYRVGLVEKIGIENMEWLESKHEPKKYTIDELKEIKQGFNQWARELEKEME